jgi:hypothetical protein
MMFKRLTFLFVASISMPSLLMAGSIELDLAIHEAAQKAKAAGRTNILVVVREDYRSEQDANVSTVLNALEQIAVKDLAAEKLKSVINTKATDVARKYKARRGLRPGEFAKYREHAEFDAILSIDFKANGKKLSVRVSLVDSGKVLSTDYVTLMDRPEPPKTKTEKPNTDKTDKKPMPNGSKKGAKKDKADPFLDGPDPTKLPRPENGATAFIMRRPNAPRIVRDTGRRIQGQKNRPNPNREGGPDGEGRPKRDGEGLKKGDEGDRERPPKEKGDKGKPNEDRSSVEETQAIRNTNLQVGEIGRGILRFATDSVGKKVGNGQCWTLADHAMRASGAEPPKGYTYGNKVDLKDVKPGDILQFKTARFDEPGYWAIMGSPDHTAVVQSVGTDRIYMLHQNFAGKKIVQTFDINPNNMTSGTMEVWRPIPRMPRR